MSQSLPFSAVIAQGNQYKLNFGQPQSDNASLWTASRCQRLLHPIISRTGLLKKDHTRNTTGWMTDFTKPLTIPETEVSNLTTKRSRECNEEDKCWARNKKRARRTYTMRNKALEISNGEDNRVHRTACEKKNQGHKPRLRPGEFLVLTPILKRSKSSATNSGCTEMTDLELTASSESRSSKAARRHNRNKGREPYYDLAECMQNIKIRTSVLRFKVYEGIYGSLEELLKAVTQHEGQLPLSLCDRSTNHVRQHVLTPKNPLSKSLFSMCLRKIPNYMEEQENSAAFEADAGAKTSFDIRTTSAEIYAHLESLGTSRMGWKHLKTVVRVHGIKVICDAIENSLLDASIASVLVMLCVHMSVLDGAESILTSLLKSCVYPAPESFHSHFRDDPTSLPLSTLEKFFKYTGIASFYHCQLTNLLASGSLAITWLCTKQFTHIWTSLFHTLSIDPFDHDVVNFMTTALPMLYRAQLSMVKKQGHLSSNQLSLFSVLDTTLASVLTTLLIMSELSSSHMRSVSHVLKSTIIDCKLTPSKICCHASALIVIANLLLSAEEIEDVGFTQELVRYFAENPWSLLYQPKPDEIISSFICSVAQCGGKVFSKDGFKCLKALLEKLMSFGSSSNSDGICALQHIVLDSAFAFAGHHPDARHLQYAKLIGSIMPRHSFTSKSSSGICQTGPELGFQWEEGINEWVMATPAFESDRGGLARSLVDPESEVQSSIQVTQIRDTPVHPIKNMANSDRLSQVSSLTPETSRKYSKNSSWQAKSYHRSGKSLCVQILSPELDSSTQPGLCLKRETRSIGPMRDIFKTSENHSFQSRNDDELGSDLFRNVLQEKPNLMKHSTNVRQRKKQAFQNSRRRRGDEFPEQSEDELALTF